eukprot:gnl/Dysnectes_brevis/2920_a3580_1016.p1 GENE.gnl/Dysnectes_brevis/2920_a3580_1016~~gnl/Dysnectes_brevis/2920_a3580_1016.p1  ORF type:complete len:376 (+),score=63.22 gnl/Dysnectes_brevis/2920_a3580_1016:77-1204(+)
MFSKKKNSFSSLSEVDPELPASKSRSKSKKGQKSKHLGMKKTSKPPTRTCLTEKDLVHFKFGQPEPSASHTQKLPTPVTMISPIAKQHASRIHKQNLSTWRAQLKTKIKSFSESNLRDMHSLFSKSPRHQWRSILINPPVNLSAAMADSLTKGLDSNPPRLTARLLKLQKPFEQQWTQANFSALNAVKQYFQDTVYDRWLNDTGEDRFVWLIEHMYRAKVDVSEIEGNLLLLIGLRLRNQAHLNATRHGGDHKEAYKHMNETFSAIFCLTQWGSNAPPKPPPVTEPPKTAQGSGPSKEKKKKRAIVVKKRVTKPGPLFPAFQDTRMVRTPSPQPPPPAAYTAKGPAIRGHRRAAPVSDLDSLAEGVKGATRKRKR